MSNNIKLIEKVVNGKICIAKKIFDKSKKSKISQVPLSSSLKPDEKRGICLFDSIIEGDDGLILVREKRQGITLEEFLAKQPLPVEEAVDLFIKIAKIVQTAHAHKIVHGDIKPSNIIISEKLKPVGIKNSEEYISIVDWGYAEIVSDSDKPCNYMPLELLKGESADYKSDVYELGAVLYKILVRKTPFAESKDIINDKAQKEPRNIKSEYPDLGVSAELATVVESSLKNDRNSRIQSVDEFINRLQNIVKSSKSKSKATLIKPASAAPNKESRIKEERKLVLIGHTGAGKTVLAAGLYSSQDKDFYVEVSGSKSQTGGHVINTISNIEEGEWPAATDIGTLMHLKFKINYKKYEEHITFDEYAGERLANANYESEILGKPDGAFILLNPGGKQWWITREKNSLISDIKYYISLLSKMENKPPIALVITASDRLGSDLKDRADSFYKYIGEIKTKLDLAHCKYKEFKVSVTGKLESQDKPKLDPQHIKDPFKWIIKQFIAKDKKRKFMRGLKKACLFAAIASVFAGGEFLREWHKTSSLKSGFESAQTEHRKKKNSGNSDSLIEYRNLLVEIRNRACSQNHVENAKRNGACTNRCKPFFIYPIFEKTCENLISEIEKEIDSTNNDYFNLALKKAIENPNKSERAVEKEIVAWKPLTESYFGNQKELQARAQKELPALFERSDFKALLEKFQNLVKDPKPGYPKDLVDEYDRLSNLKTSLPDKEREALDKEIYEAYYKSYCAVLEREIIKADLGRDINNLIPLFEDLYDFKKKFFKDGKASKSADDIEKKSYACLDAFISFQKNAELAKNKDKFEEPQYPKELKEKLFQLLDESKKEEYEKSIEDSVADLKKQWCKQKEKEVDDFIEYKLAYVNLETSLDEFKEFYYEHNANPYINKAEKYVLDKIKTEFDKRFKNWDNTETSYRSLKELCAKIKNIQSDYIKKSPYYRFAQSYFEWMVNPTISVKIRSIEARSTYPDGAYIKALYYKKSNDQSWNVAFEGKDSNEDIFKGRGKPLPPFNGLNVECKPWEDLIIALKPYENREKRVIIDWADDKELEWQYLRFKSYNKSLIFNERERKSGEELLFGQIYLKIDFAIYGETINEIWRESQKQ